MKRYILLFSYLLFCITCRTTNDSADSNLMTHPPISFHGISGKMNNLTPAQKDRLVRALQEIKKAFYLTNDGYKQTPDNRTLAPTSDITTCLTVVPGRWSDLTSHYYCTYPGYHMKYYPNIRECFTFLVMPSIDATIDGKKPNYDEAYDYCVYMPIDKDSSGNYKHLAIKDYPPFEPSNKANNNRLGPMAWVQEHQPDVFKFVMSGSTCTINPRVQQEILNKYYGVDLKGKLDYTSNDSEQVAECRKKRPIIKAAGSHPGDLSDPIDGTHCSYDMRRKTPSPIEDCY